MGDVMRSKYSSSRPEGKVLSARAGDLSVTASAFLYRYVHAGVPLLEEINCFYNLVIHQHSFIVLCFEEQFVFCFFYGKAF
jgi:hypothetical protein